MKRLLPLLLALLLLCSLACAEETTPAFEPIPWDVEVSPNLPNPACYAEGDLGYHDDSIDISFEMDRAFDTDIMLMRVKLTDITQMRAQGAGRYPSKNATPVKRMTKQVSAIGAISGDYYSYHDDGIVVRNTHLYRNRVNTGRDTLIIDQNGDFTIFAPTSKEAWDAYDKSQAVHVFCYGPALVTNGVQLTDMNTVRLSCGKNKLAQRLVIAQTGHLEYLIIATEGPENKGSRGLTIAEIAQYCADLGLQNAYNLDGGSSSTIVMNNRKINALSTHKERPVGDCIWFATLVPSN